MSIWQSLINKNLVGSAKVRQAAIYGLDGKVWATSLNFKVEKDEFNKLLAAFDNPKSIKANVFCIGGVSYKIFTATKSSIYAQKFDGGVVCRKANKAIVIGVYDDKIRRDDATQAVEELGDYLRSTTS